LVFEVARTDTAELSSVVGIGKLHAPSKRPDYGLDAPGAVRNLAIGCAAALVLAAAAEKVPA
jgi:hypothetical protein